MIQLLYHPLPTSKSFPVGEVELVMESTLRCGVRESIGGARAAGIAAGLGAAALFGASAPFAKLLLADASPLTVSGLLYLGGGLALAAVRFAAARNDRSETPLRGSDAPPLLAITAIGGILGPFLMMTGIARLRGADAALLLNLEAVFTIAFAVVLFGEHLGRAEAGAACFVVAGATVLAYAPGSVPLVGAAAIAAACICWALDNNLSQRLSVRDPVTVACAKALGAGAASVLLACAVGARLPRASTIALALILGAISFGVSLWLDLLALRALGAAREAAIFATAPFIGALTAVPVLGDRIGPREAVAGGLMAVGALVLVRARHSHVHTHDEIFHDHAHSHDIHHRHAHADEPPPALHSHPHRHEPLTHEHAHVSDVHHRHSHRVAKAPRAWRSS